MALQGRQLGIQRTLSFPAQGPGPPAAALRSANSFSVRHTVTGPAGPLLSARGPRYSALPQSPPVPFASARPADTNNWLGTRGLFFEAEYQLPEQDQWMFVGRGRGSHTKVPEYRLVGSGQGEFVKGGDKVYSWRLRTHCIACLALVLLALVGVFLWLLLDPDDPLHVEANPGRSNEPFDCNVFSAGRVKTWSQEQQKYCCESYDIGCDMVMGGDDSNTTHNCGHDFDEWESAWSEEKKDWCCRHHLRGCRQDPLGKGCRSLCDFDGVEAPCKARVQWAADNIFAAQSYEDACAPAYDMVMVQCPICREAESGCDFHSMRCRSGPDQRAAAGRRPSERCRRNCTLGGVEGTCASHVKRLAETRFAQQNHSCALALGLVLYGCPACEMCTLASTGCGGAAEGAESTNGGRRRGGLGADLERHVGRVHDDVKHHVGKAHDDVKHHVGKAHDDVKHHVGKAASAAGDKLADWHHDSTSHLENAKDGVGDALGRVWGGITGATRWVFGLGGDDDGSGSKESGGRAPSPSPDSHKSEHKHGEEELFDCNKHFDDGSWKHNWSAGQKLWCCNRYARGCPDGEQPSQECDKGDVAGWSSRKKSYCCETQNKGCPKRV